MENRYDKYKDSGIAWIGEIPEHWKVKKGKNLFKKEERPVRDNDEIVTCFRDGEVTLRSNRRIDGFTNAMKEVGYQGVRRGDLVIHNMDAFAGAIGVSDSDGKSTPVYSVCTPKNNVEANVYYYAYLLRSYALGGVIQSLAKGIRERSTDFRYKEFGDLYYQQPPIEEQQSIASYLDQKCGEIDKLITLQEEMITKLQSYKQSVITEAVTKGLDKNLPLKDSGIEWIGEIPEHWSVVKIKYLAKIKSGDSISSNEIMQEGIYEVYGGNGLMGFCNKKNVDGVNIIIGRVGALCGNVRLISESKFITDNALILNCFDNALYSYMYIMLKAANLNNLNTSNAQPLITGSKVLNVSLPIPPLSEQQSIADYLDQKCSEIDELISIKQQKIEKLKDYKKSLIFECVTGKRKV
ncbi:restriction endonuclease subunit S [uncultured Phocaeicola sp.]|jgi:type I restriction enzyme S subunit|uniref:restriction endonuclease subunit S n=1 Tax=uncultured Phocaeicola sp. TaxID=990718 RepID=UPI0025CC9EF5|nr:restriction endonuclease subunit S [uncultured Phocaeicola sp.]